MGIPDHLTRPLRNLYAGQEATEVLFQEPDLEQWIGSKLRTEFGQGIHNKAVYRCSAYLTYMQSTSWEMLAWMKHKLESRLLGEI